VKSIFKQNILTSSFPSHIWTACYTTSIMAPAARTDRPAAMLDSKSSIGSMTKPPTFTDAYDEREYLKGRLAAAFRIFGKFGFDEGVAGHITCRVGPR
jgi:hypothetical protein